jgi:hypothetical protein
MKYLIGILIVSLGVFIIVSIFGSGLEQIHFPSPPSPAPTLNKTNVEKYIFDFYAERYKEANGIVVSVKCIDDTDTLHLVCGIEGKRYGERWGSRTIRATCQVDGYCIFRND